MESIWNTGGTDKTSQASFPWYKRMDALMGTSPAVSKAALAHSGNSASQVDLSVLSRDGGVMTWALKKALKRGVVTTMVMRYTFKTVMHYPLLVLTLYPPSHL